MNLNFVIMIILLWLSAADTSTVAVEGTEGRPAEGGATPRGAGQPAFNKGRGNFAYSGRWPRGRGGY